MFLHISHPKNFACGAKSFSRNDTKCTSHNPKISPAAPQKLLVGKPDSHIFQIFFVGKLISHCPVFSLGSGLPFVFRFFSSNVVHFVCVSPCSTFFVYVLVQKPLQLQRNSQNTVVSTLLMKTECYCTYFQVFLAKLQLYIFLFSQ